MGLQISLCKFHKNSLTERLLEKKAVTLWDELTENKAVSQKISFQFLMEDMSFFTIALYGLPNITLQIPQEQSSGKASGGETCNSVRWINRTQSSFSESFFPVFNWSYFLFHHSLLRASKYHFANSTGTVLAKGFLKGNSISVRRINRTQSSFSESFFPIFNGRYFLLHHCTLWAFKYHFANSPRTVLANGFLRGKLTFCQMN